MTAKQHHGFVNEDITLESEGNYYKDPKYHYYTSEYDSFNGDHEGVYYPHRPVQEKCIGIKNAVEFGDLFRNASKKEDFELIVRFWSQKKPLVISHEDRFLVDHVKWHKHFSPFEHYKEMKEWIKGVSNSKDYNEQWKKERTLWKKKWHSELPHSKITPTFKRDSKNQRRIQCSVSAGNWESFVKSVRKE